MTDETTPDAVTMLQRMHARAVHSANRGEVPRISSAEVLAVLRTVQAERERHAEEVARLRDVHLDETRALDDLRLKEIASLRDQLRRVEGEREEARAQVAEVQHGHDALLQRADQAERELGAWQDWALTHCDPGDGSDDRHLRELVGSQLASLRALLPDVRLIAESAMYETTGGESCPEVLTREARAARRILAALDSQGGEGE